MKPAVIVLNSQVARGSVGGRAMVFALERLEHRVWFVPTVLLPWHPGHGRASRIATDPAAFAVFLDDLAGARWLDEVGAIATGYFADAAQVEAAARLVEAVKARRPETLFLCDPVMGDVRADGTGGLYIPEATAAAIRNRLVPLADIVTPNLFELSYLTSSPLPQSSTDAVAAARRLPVSTVVVTSAPAMMARAIGTLLVEGDTVIQAEHPLIEGAPNGTGDLLSSLFLAARLAGRNSEQSLQRAVASVFGMAARAARKGADELPLSAEQDVLVHSLLAVSTRRIASTQARRPPPRRPERPSDEG